jgi:hypothetical protein
MLDGIRTYERQRRFWRLVDVRGRDECWPWLGHVDRDGQGWFRGSRADAIAYQRARGPLPAGARLEHGCGDRRCMNPEHMERLAGD